MTDTELLKEGRNRLLALHKSLVDLERSLYEEINGRVTAGEFLNLLLEDPRFGWLRRFSALIVDIDEMFAQKDGFTAEAVSVHLQKMHEIVLMEDDDEDFLARYRAALQKDMVAASQHGELRGLIGAKGASDNRDRGGSA